MVYYTLANFRGGGKAPLPPQYANGVIGYLVMQRRDSMQTTRNVLLSFGSAISQLTDTKVSISENYSADTEYNRNKLYMIYRKAKSIDKYTQKVFLNGDVLILEGKRYYVDDLADLPADLHPRLFNEKANDKCYVFGGVHSKFNPFSNWYPCRIQHGDHSFKSVEQANYQHSKAVYVGDVTSATK